MSLFGKSCLGPSSIDEEGCGLDSRKDCVDPDLLTALQVFWAISVNRDASLCAFRSWHLLYFYWFVSDSFALDSRSLSWISPTPFHLSRYDIACMPKLSPQDSVDNFLSEQSAHLTDLGPNSGNVQWAECTYNSSPNAEQQTGTFSCTAHIRLEH